MSTMPPAAAPAQEVAAVVEKIVEALDAARERLDFNDEPARFYALLGASPPRPRK